MRLETGTRLAGYEVLGSLGAGGMGEVYRARDLRLGREVALKVLPADIAADPERRARFEREARAASALNHPNIVTIHGMDAEDGIAFIVMERVEGRTLRDLLARGPLDAPTLGAIATQVADGLARAHAAGIVHRDLKPENVMVTPDGRVKILDFGLAKVQPVAADTADVETHVLSRGSTEPGVVMGTLGYMSPEQARGQAVDHRSDQFSLGAILYEMATGRRAFVRPTVAESLAAILRDQPEPLARVRPAAPRGLGAVVERCLAKQPASRYASTGDLLRDLQAVSWQAVTARPARVAATAGGVVVLATVLALALAWRRAPEPAPPARAVSTTAPALAVLPFEQLGPAEDEDYADGMTDAITTDVAKVPGLVVIARDTAFRYKGQAADHARLADELGVRYVLHGSVQRSGGRLRVTARLVDTTTGLQTWADRYDRDAKDVFAIQDEIGRHVASALHLALGRREARRVPTSHPEAYEAYLRALSFEQRFDWREKDKAIPLLERAVALDPAFAVAHAELAAHYARKSFERDPDREWESKAFVELEKALVLDPTLSDPYVTRGNLVLTTATGFQYERAIADYRRALELDPHSLYARGALASAYVHVGLLDRAMVEYRAALRTAPGDSAILMRIARIHLYRAEFAEALVELRRSGELARSWQVVLALQGLGRVEEARRLAEETVPQEDRFREDFAAAYALVLAAEGKPQVAEAQIASAVRQGEGSSHFHHAQHSIAGAYALMGRKTEAVRWLRRAAAEGLPCYPAFDKDPNLRGLKGDPAFDALLSELKTAWERRSREL